MPNNHFDISSKGLGVCTEMPVLQRYTQR